MILFSGYRNEDPSRCCAFTAAVNTTRRRVLGLSGRRVMYHRDSGVITYCEVCAKGTTGTCHFQGPHSDHATWSPSLCSNSGCSLISRKRLLRKEPWTLRDWLNFYRFQIPLFSKAGLTSPIFQLASTPSTYLSGTPLWIWHLAWLWGHPAVLEGAVSKATTWAWWDCNSSFPCCFVSNAQRPHSTRSQGERRGSGGGRWKPRDGGLPQPMREVAGWQRRLRSWGGRAPRRAQGWVKVWEAGPQGLLEGQINWFEDIGK